MNRRRTLPWILGLVVGVCAAPSRGEEAPPAAPRPAAEAVALGLKVLAKGAANYPEHRQCFSCHHQTLPLLALIAARDAGREIDADLVADQTRFTLASFRGRTKDLLAGTGIGGRGMTVGYGLWTLDLVGQEPDETTAAMVAFLLKAQGKDGSWRPPSNRPPLEESAVSCTVLAAYGIDRYATDEQREAADKSLAQARAFLAQAPLRSHEDHVFRLWGLKLLGPAAGEDGPAQIETARAAVLVRQHDDGGWSQLPEMASDAYATGQTLYVLRELGAAADEPAVARGVAFLRATQQEDGSWRVETRSKPVQVFFDNGDPHGKSQFISLAATGWAVTALLSGSDDKPLRPTAAGPASPAPPPGQATQPDP